MGSIGHIHNEHKFQMSVEMKEVESGGSEPAHRPEL